MTKQEVLDYLDNVLHPIVSPNNWNVYSELYDMIEELPSAEPVQHGKWIDETFEPWGLVHHPYKCNLCGEHAEFASPYCPNCGAYMRGEE